MPRTWGRTSNVPLSDWRPHRVISHWSISCVFLSDWSSDCVISHWSVSGDYSLIGPVIVSSAIGPSAADYSVIGPQVMSLSHCSTDVLLGGCCTAMLHSDWPSHCSISVLPSDRPIFVLLSDWPVSTQRLLHRNSSLLLSDGSTSVILSAWSLTVPHSDGRDSAPFG